MTNHADQTETDPYEMVTVAEAAYEAVSRAWRDDPGSPELLRAYITTRQQLHQARHRAIDVATADRQRTASGGPTIITPVIEWWQA